jgi:hypothetical protein
MKRCPTCQKTFDDNMRFCQTDGTPLVEDTTPADPYKTMVASKEDIQSALNAASTPEPSAPAGIGAPDDEPLELPSKPPQSEPASEFETKIAGRDVIEIPPIAESEPAPAPPPSFGEPSTPPSPFAAQSGGNDFPTTPPIPSPFGGSAPPPRMAAEPEVIKAEPEEPTYFEPETVSEPEPAPAYNEPAAPASPFADPAPPSNPFEGQSAPPPSPMAQSQWTPSPPPVQQSSGPGGSFTPPPPAASGAKLNQTLPIVSLVSGIVSLCCYISPLTGLIALVTGFLGLKNIKNDPGRFGGKPLALVGMILGGLFFLIGLVYYIIIFFFGGAAMIMDTINRMS